MKLSHLLPFTALAFLACNSESGNTSETTDSTAAVIDTVAQPEIVLAQLWATDSVLKSSESVLYNKTNNILYISCINGQPSDMDQNGYITKLNIDGSIDNLKWIDGLNAPKGLGMFKNKLYVTDITELVEIDIEKGKVIKKHKVPGAIFLNDITVDTSGTVYFTDSETNKIHTLINGKVSTWLDAGLSKPNGLLVEPTRLLLASYGSNDFKAIDLTTKEITGIATEIGAGDGIVYMGKPGHYVVSEWEGDIYLIEPDGSKNLILTNRANKINSADIEYIQETNTLLVPTFFNNKVVAYKLTHND